MGNNSWDYRWCWAKCVACGEETQLCHLDKLVDIVCDECCGQLELILKQGLKLQVEKDD